MQFDRALVALLASVLLGCPDEKPLVTSRVDAVTTKPPPIEPTRFCDRTWPSTGDKAVAWQPPPTRRLAGAPPTAPVKGWRWLNAWATWCGPCVDEMSLLARWRDTFEQDGLEVTFDLLSIDEPTAEPELKKWMTRPLPGPISWISAPDDFPAWLEKSLGFNPDAAIPIHVLVDPSGKVRCARVGAVHAQDYGAVRALLTRG